MPCPGTTTRPIVVASDAGATSEPYPKIHVLLREGS
jgi:hypothetical protein